MSRNQKTVIFEKQTTTQDHVTGEVTQDHSEKIIKLPYEPPYIKMYIDDLGTFIGVPESEKKLLLMVLRKLDYDGYITLSSRYREQICKVLKIKNQVLRNKLSSLVKNKLLINTSYGEYMANPDYFARGSWADICKTKKVWEMHIKYSDKGREVKTEVHEEQTDMFDNGFDSEAKA